MEIDFNNLEINKLYSNSDFEKKVHFFLKEWFSKEDKVKVQTSGSTGTPKIFEIEKQRMLYSASMTCDFLNLKKGDKALLCLPVEYISGKMMMVRSFERKLKLILSTPALKPLENLNKEIDFCAMTPLQVENSLDKIHLVKKIIIGGAAVSYGLKNRIYNALQDSNTVIYETYGMSETLSHIALRQIYPKEDLFFNVFEGVQISKDERGCLTIFAPNINAELLKTNDLVEIFNEKQFRYIGRVDHIINSGGVKIFPEELESLVKREISNEIVFIGMSDEVLGQKLVVVIEGEDTDFIRQKIDDLSFDKKYYKPKEIIFVSEIPRTPNGKVNRLKMKEILESNL